MGPEVLRRKCTGPTMTVEVGVRETRHAHLQKTAHSRADEVFVRHSIYRDILGQARAEYGGQIVSTLSR